MARVVAVFTGGTISMEPDARAGGAVPVLRGEQIVARTPGLERIGKVEPVDWGLVPASHMGLPEMLDIGRLLARHLERDEIDGAVVVQGTDTIEETAFAWDVLLASDKPVVVTGAMRHAADPDYDGPRNLRDAVRAASAPELLGQGTLVVMAGRVIGADQAVKAHATSMNAFQPRDGDLVGDVSDEGVFVQRRRTGRPRLPVLPSEAEDAVHLVTAVSGMNGTLLRLLAPSRPAGVVVAATGAGNTHPDMLAAAAELMAAGATIVLTTRCAGGAVAPAYAFPGGGATWQRAGAILSPLSGPKARVALGLGIAAGLSLGELRWLLRASEPTVEAHPS